MGDFANSRFANRHRGNAITLRRILLELWAISLLASVIGFMGPFGTYLDDDLVGRILHWWPLLVGAYLLIRPSIIALEFIASSTALPTSSMVFWGVVAASVPLAFIWRTVGKIEFRALNGYTGLLPFALLCALAVLGVTRWAGHMDRRLRRSRPRQAKQTGAASTAAGKASAGMTDEPALRTRLSDGFTGPILALQSEDHYVRVHGEHCSELILIRLRDAIAEMGAVAGQQVHRSWWVASIGVASARSSGRSWAITLKNGEVAPVARDSVARLQKDGLIPIPTKT